MRKDTLMECERISLILEKLASQGAYPQYTFRTDADSRVLALAPCLNKDVGYGATDLTLNLDFMEKWFAQCGFKVVKNIDSYCHYFFGTLWGYVITIKPI